MLQHWHTERPHLSAEDAGLPHCDEATTDAMKKRAASSLRALLYAADHAMASLNSETRSRIESLLAPYPAPADRREELEMEYWRMTEATPHGTTRIGGGWAAVVHERGRPRWGPVRRTVEQAVADRKVLAAARKSKTIPAALAQLREPP